MVDLQRFETEEGRDLRDQFTYDNHSQLKKDMDSERS